ncbi:MAG: hypothetical protein JOY90_34315 [Bradyrhizobium sp.]|uniref:hypothetical protein n=1 Tax=Bradyrhizobium sp. TaxID=376 RepID=UPI001DB5C52F|nr:hypothetical protein [Bradyrhizobium sp.]MBV9565489.1 hypothetical protein [Bradyrhizobium sp.]
MLRLAALRIVLFAIGGLGMAWGGSNLARGAALDELQNLESRLLQFETFGPAAAADVLQDAPVDELSGCDNHAHRSLLLLEMPLAEAALRAGAVTDFDRHLGSIESRARQVLACAPRDPLVWLILFGHEIERGQLDEHAFDLLATSYEISPHEAWIGTRRMAVALPVVMAAPAPVQQQVLAEFRNLVRHGFVEIPARSYLSTTAATRALLQAQVDALDVRSRQAFADALEKLRS